MDGLLSDADYKYILSQVVQENPFVSGNNGSLNTPQVPAHLSLVHFNRKKKRKAEHDMCVTGSCNAEQCIRKKVKGAYDEDMMIDLTI